MSQTEFDAAIRALSRRLELLRAAKVGTVKLRRVRVKAYDVAAYSVGAHWRHIAPRPQRARVLRAA